MGIRKILVEGGGTLIYNLLINHIIDEVRILYMPFFVGNKNCVSVVHGNVSLFDKLKLNINHIEYLDGFVLLIGGVNYEE